MELTGSAEQQIIFLNLHWGRTYEFTAPDTASTAWKARAKFGEQDELQEDSAAGLLLAVRAHYAAKKFSAKQ